MRIRRRHPISSKEIEKVRQELSNFLSPEAIDSILRQPLEHAAGDEHELILSDREPVVFTTRGGMFPTLKGFLRIDIDNSYLTVDSGAVPYLINGADVMAPGIVQWDHELSQGELCVVTEERHNKPICVAEMLVDSIDIDPEEKGKVAENIHHVGDQLWNSEIE